MPDKIAPKIVRPKGYVQADQLTVDNIQDWADSLGGTIEEGILVFKIDDYTHRAIPDDWIVVFRPSGDLLVIPNKFFNRIYEVDAIG